MRCITLSDELSYRGYTVRLCTDDTDLAHSVSPGNAHLEFIPEGEFLPFPLSPDVPFDILITDLPPFKGDEIFKERVLQAINQLDNVGIPVVSIGHISQVSHAFRAIIDLYPGRSVHSANYINGPEYLILRPDFQSESSGAAGNGLLLTFGGSDPHNMTGKLLKSLVAQNFGNLITVVLGLGYDSKNRRQIELLAKGSENLIEVLENVENMRQLMESHRLGVTAFGTTAFEFMKIGTPCITFSHYLWQQPSAVLFDKLNCCKYLGCEETGIDYGQVAGKIIELSGDHETLDRISKTSTEIVDGKGVKRVADMVSKFVDEKEENVLDILYLLAHPGDEAFGCGGTIINDIKSGKKIGVAFLGEGISSRFEEYVNPHTSIENSKLKSSAQRAMDLLGVKIWYNYQFKDNRFDHHDFLELVKVLERLINRHKPKTIYTHHPNDLNIDHKLTFEAVMTACRPVRAQPVRHIFSVEVPSSSDWGNTSGFKPNWTNDISNTLEEKLKLIAIYTSEIREDPHPRSIEGIKQRSLHWGRLFGLKAAEVFQLHRFINTNDLDDYEAED